MADTTTRHLAVDRRAQVLDALRRHGTVRVSDLAAELDVTPVTVRRDIALLVDSGLARRVHGGATLAATDSTPAPNPTAQPARSIGMLVPSLDYYWPGVARGAEERATTAGVRIHLRGSSYDSEDERPQLERLLAVGGGSDALLVAPALDSPHADDVLAWLDGLDVPVVLLERTVPAGSRHTTLESVVSDHALGAELAVRHLAELGHRRVGLALSSHSPHGPLIRTGWQRAVADCDLSGTIDMNIPDRGATDWQTRVEYVVEAAISTGTTGLLVHSDPEAMGVVQHCEERGIPVPQALSVIAYDDEVAGLFSPALTAIRPPRAWIGRAAVDLVTARWADPDRPLHRIVVNPSLVVRDSSTPPV